ncbi:hypothetical protein EYE40_11545 [Glaciihabitans arcticus]|uniref:Uncharacterized protein n=1 Tax=Glaciihabitans arcticus TaxID=2668039 RepID=A0A4Q9GXK6_9MICO|nr:hypothetical protein [Glaciihabitans arcticus]TBN57977.1 hypothetical protein EYE40_11545 [Glaciihabitans arcticus]
MTGAEIEAGRSWIASVASHVQNDREFSQRDIDELIDLSDERQVELASLALSMFSAMVDEATEATYLLVWIPLGERDEIPGRIPSFEALLQSADFTGSLVGLSVPGFLVAGANPSDWNRSAVEFRAVLDHPLQLNRETTCCRKSVFHPRAESCSTMNLDPESVAQLVFEDMTALQERRLRLLAYWMNRSDGPLTSMDGTLDSADELREWFVTFVESGCPGIPEDARPRLSYDGSVLPYSDENRAWNVAEMITPYWKMIYAKVDPSAHYSIHRDKTKRKTGSHLATVIKLSNGSFATPGFAAVTGSRVAEVGRAGLRMAPWSMLLKNFVPPGFFPDTQERGESLLTPLLTSEQPAIIPPYPQSLDFRD